MYEKFKDNNIITDRHILSNYCWSGSNETDYIFEAIYKSIGAPDFTFLIYASPQVVAQRLQKRDVNDPDLGKVSYITKAYAKMEQLLKKYNMPSLLIDTSHLSEDEVVESMIKELTSQGLIHG